MSYIHDIQYSTNGRFWNLPNIKMTGLVLHSVGCPQPKADVFAKNFNKPTAKASIHGVIEPGRFIEMAPCFKQEGYAKKCYHVGAGSKGSYNASRFGIEMTEPNTIQYTGGATFTDLNPQKTKEFICEVTNTAAQVFADLCIYHNIPVSMITTHKEAHKSGYGSNHGDPEHLWSYIGYTLQQFRKDVQSYIDEKKGDVLPVGMTKEELQEVINTSIKSALLPVYKTLDEVPAWARNSVEKAINMGCISGTGEVTSDGKPIYDLDADIVRIIKILDNLGTLGGDQ